MPIKNNGLAAKIGLARTLLNGLSSVRRRQIDALFVVTNPLEEVCLTT